MLFIEINFIGGLTCLFFVWSTKSLLGLRVVITRIRLTRFCSADKIAKAILIDYLDFPMYNRMQKALDVWRCVRG